MGPESSGGLPGQEVRLLIVDDEEFLRRTFVRMLKDTGYSIEQASTGREAIGILDKKNISAIVSDINMPGMNGMELLRAVRERDLDLPVILITGDPSIESAARAVEYGALRYLLKPVDKKTFVRAVQEAVKLRELARLKRQAAMVLGAENTMAGDRAGLEANLAKALKTLWMAYQPIVDPRTKRIHAFEALVRTNEPSVPHPGVLFSIAERLGRVHEVGRVIRSQVAQTLRDQQPEADIFINLHPADLLDDGLFDANSLLASMADRVVLEVTERASLDSGADITGRISRLRELGFRIAIDDLGAGYAGLSYFALLSPDVVKLDIELIRDIDTNSVKEKLVGALTTLCNDLGMIVVAEGIETLAERDAVVDLGCDLLQGFFFARPGAAYPTVKWES